MPELKRGQLTRKDMNVLRETASARNQYKKNSGTIKDYSLKHRVRLGWGVDDEDRDLRPFYLYLDDDQYLLSWGELKDAEHSGFFRRESDETSYNLRWLDGAKVTIDTELNDEAERDMIFRLTTDEHEVILDWYEFLRLGRFI